MGGPCLAAPVPTEGGAGRKGYNPNGVGLPGNSALWAGGFTFDFGSFSLNEM